MKEAVVVTALFKLGPCLRGHVAVARGVDRHVGADVEDSLFAHQSRPGHAAAIHQRLIRPGVQQEIRSGLGDQISVLEIEAIGVDPGAADTLEDFTDEGALRTSHQRSDSCVDPHPAKPSVTLGQEDLGATPGRHDGSADSSGTAAADQDVDGDFLRLAVLRGHGEGWTQPGSPCRNGSCGRHARRSKKSPSCPITLRHICLLPDGMRCDPLWQKALSVSSVREGAIDRWPFFGVMLVVCPGPAIVLPIYFLRTRGFRGLLSIAKAFGVFIWLVAVAAIGVLGASVLMPG